MLLNDYTKYHEIVIGVTKIQRCKRVQSNRSVSDYDFHTMTKVGKTTSFDYDWWFLESSIWQLDERYPSFWICAFCLYSPNAMQNNNQPWTRWMQGTKKSKISLDEVDIFDFDPCCRIPKMKVSTASLLSILKLMRDCRFYKTWSYRFLEMVCRMWEESWWYNWNAAHGRDSSQKSPFGRR